MTTQRAVSSNGVRVLIALREGPQTIRDITAAVGRNWDTDNVRGVLSGLYSRRLVEREEVVGGHKGHIVLWRLGTDADRAMAVIAPVVVSPPDPRLCPEHQRPAIVLTATGPRCFQCCADAASARAARKNATVTSIKKARRARTKKLRQRAIQRAAKRPAHRTAFTIDPAAEALVRALEQPWRQAEPLTAPLYDELSVQLAHASRDMEGGHGYSATG